MADRRPGTGETSFTVVVTAQAHWALEQVEAFYLHAPEVYDRVLVALEEAFSRLSRFPEIGHEGWVEGTREWTMTGFELVMVYRVLKAQGEVQVVDVVPMRARE